MKQYPSIPRVARPDFPVLAFDKLDGSLIRAEWNRKSGFYKYGRKHGLLDHSNEVLLKAPALIQTKYEDQLNLIFRKNRWTQVIAFFEFLGTHSFAGQHLDDDDHRVVLLDVNPYKQGILDPRIFRKLFGDLDIPQVLHEGKVNQEFVDSVKTSTLSGMTAEGVVCKGNNPKKPKHRLMFKLKSDAWMTKLREYCNGDVNLFNKLA